MSNKSGKDLMHLSNTHTIHVSYILYIYYLPTNQHGYPIGSMGLVIFTNLLDFYGFHVGKFYRSSHGWVWDMNSAKQANL